MKEDSTLVESATTSEMYYVYQLVDPRDNCPFYVGKGLNKRCYDHFGENELTTCNRHKFYKIRHLHSINMLVKIEILEKDILCESDAYDIEERYIDKYGRIGYDENGILTNVCKNNRPPSHKGKIKSKEHRMNLSKSHSGKIVSDKTKAKMSKITKQRILDGEFGMAGKKHSIDTKRKISESKQGAVQSIDSNRRRSLALKGKSWSVARRKAYENKRKADVN